MMNDQIVAGFQLIHIMTEKNRPATGRADFTGSVCFIQNLVSNHLTLSIYCAKMFL